MTNPRSDPRNVSDPLKLLAEIASAMHHGRAAWDQRIDELGGGYPSQGEGSPGNASLGGPTAAAVIAIVDDKRTDVADIERKAWERDLRKALEHAGAMWARYQRIVTPRMGVDMAKDPGCDLCSQITEGHCDRCTAYGKAHWCAARYTVEVPEPAKRKGQPDTVRKVRLCSSCYSFQRPDQAGRLPDHGDVLDHAEGRRRRWKAS